MKIIDLGTEYDDLEIPKDNTPTPYGDIRIQYGAKTTASFIVASSDIDSLHIRMSKLEEKIDILISLLGKSEEVRTVEELKK